MSLGETTLPSDLAARIHREGPVRFDVAMELLLYGTHGFFTRGGGAGRRADFLTSPEVGPLFGAVVARALDAEWTRLGRPDPFVVVEAGAGRGALALSVLRAGPACLRALRYVCVERSPVLLRRIEDVLPVEPPSNVAGSRVGEDGEPVVPLEGPVVTAIDELPLGPVSGVVIANELLDNLPFRLLERRIGVWQEVLVGLDGEILVDAPASVRDEAERLAPNAPDGARIPLQHAAASWLESALDIVSAGRVVVIDYARSTAAMAAVDWREWLRTYHAHGRGGHPLERAGEQDVTADVALDQLARIRPPTAESSQAEWLRGHGIDDLVEDGRRRWESQAHVGDLAALEGRSRASEAAALLDLDGLGAFRVLEWVRP